MKRIMIFIDGNNFEGAVTKLFGQIQKIDYQKLANFVATNKCDGSLQKFYYYTAASDENGKSAQTKQFVDYLNKKIPKCIAKLGYLKVDGKRDDGSTIYLEKGTDVNIAVDLVSLAYTNAYDEAVLFSADSDYQSAINLVRQLGKNVVVGIVDQQKAGYLKDLCDDHFTLQKEDLNTLLRQTKGR
ncbi:NYN domain-containing protein [Lysinibacillus irui]|uniref:NYN domain-containing protein n=1 Tax=Lysinibacillus irui TaxID=2998077 RepID=UPI003D2D5AF8